MSLVTSIVIVVDHASPELRAALLAESDFGRGGLLTALAELDANHAGGTKYMGHKVFAAGLNYADRAFLHAWCDALPWGISNAVVLVSTEGDSPEVWLYGLDLRGSAAPSAVVGKYPEPGAADSLSESGGDERIRTAE